jgi:hypothetical protein
MDLTGTIIAVMPAQSGTSARTGNPWMSQEYVIEVPGQYPKKMVFRIFGEDRIKQFALQQGQQNVTIQFDIDAHEHNGRWFNEVRCYNVLRAVPAGQIPQPTAQAAPQGQAAPAAPFPPANAAPPQGSDDLPF